MKNQQKEELAHIKAEINSPKSRLMDLMNRIAAISPAQASELGKIIGRLESFQNK